MLQHGNGYSLTFNDGDYEHWSEEDRALFFYFVKEAWDKFHDVKKIRKDPKAAYFELFDKIRRNS